MEGKKIYVLNYPEGEKELCQLEIGEVFDFIPEEKTFISEKEFPVSNSIFIKTMLDVWCQGETFPLLLERVKEKKFKIDNFRLSFIKGMMGEVTFQEKGSYYSQIGDNIDGIPRIKDPEITIGIGIYKGNWVMGRLETNDKKWITREKKPNSYSNSLSVRLAKTIVNIAIKGDKEKTIIDPCCGVGTTIIEGIYNGYKIKGSELREKNVVNGNKNMEFLGLPPILEKRDVNEIVERYDSSIIDIPYGLFSHITKEEQLEILSSAKRISNRMVLITFENLDPLVEKAGFKILKKGFVRKGRFQREILICE